MDTIQMLVLAVGALWAALGAVSKVIYDMLNKRVTSLETENATLREEARKAVAAKDTELSELRSQVTSLVSALGKERVP